MIVHMFVINQRWVREYIAHKLLVKEAQKEWCQNGCKGEKNNPIYPQAIPVDISKITSRFTNC